MYLFLLTCLLFLGLMIMMTIAHLSRAKEVGFEFSLGILKLKYKAEFHKKESKT